MLLSQRCTPCLLRKAQFLGIQGAAKGGRQKEFDHFFGFGTLSVTFRSLFLLFCQTPFAAILLRQGEELHVKKT